MPRILTWLDGELGSTIVDRLQQTMAQAWHRWFPDEDVLQFEPPQNLKSKEGWTSATRVLRAISDVRNPDCYFAVDDPRNDIGGVEMTVHSPDGSNADKRYPYLWASHQSGVDAFIVCPYQKTRIGGAVNRLPFRHAQRNRAFLERWDPGDNDSGLCQILPLRELQTDSAELPAGVRDTIWDLGRLGSFFALRIAQLVLDSESRELSVRQLEIHRGELRDLVSACEDNTGHTQAASLYRSAQRWIQVYNCRPDSGHWERGEGQFDSIDGRLMFTLDELELDPPDERPQTLEFWLPQMVRTHPWVAEQKARGFGSKRFRNIVVVLRDRVHVRFADELASEDWALLYAEPRLVLERLDWEPGVFSVSDLLDDRSALEFARRGVRNASDASLDRVADVLSQPDLYFSSHRATRIDWEEELVHAASSLQARHVLLVPRIPNAMLTAVREESVAQIVPAEEVTKTQLLALRQLHRGRHKKNRGA